MNGEVQLGAFAETLKHLRAADFLNENGLSTQQHDPRSVVYGVLDRDARRQQGVFFSGEDWALKMAGLVEVSRWSRFIDPSAGIGDLLLALAKKLPLMETPRETLRSWSEILVAVDLRSSFLEIAWARIKAVALSRHAEMNPDPAGFSDYDSPASHLPAAFQVSDFLLLDLGLRRGDCVIMNPPYQRAKAPKGSAAGAGMRSAAALHIEHVIRNAPEGVGILALVPDVIRSGSSYRAFRDWLNEKLDIKSLAAQGHFGESADVDVTILAGVTKEKAGAFLPSNAGMANAMTTSLQDIASVSVGPVVPHRATEDGIFAGYVTTKNVPVDSEILNPPEFSRFNARLEKAPFLVVRRTSSPSDRRRARASIIRGTDQWLVENHLMIVRPKKQSLEECRRLHKLLSDSRTDAWLNERIRCRHLTVSSLKGIPVWGE